ncbi:hypothetical protein BEH94_06745 [Candidatus Altiarchaeales archaeon WOR_SM1_SCG]|nr:hypothetical protein BEH94_06745 [Candidatus Altiarchaeales archaeon WOR_SM1_SCG]
MKLINVKVPESARIRMERALSLFRQGNISTRNAAKIAGVPLREFIICASAHGIKPGFDEKMIEEETA